MKRCSSRGVGNAYLVVFSHFSVLCPVLAEMVHVTLSLRTGGLALMMSKCSEASSPTLTDREFPPTGTITGEAI